MNGYWNKSILYYVPEFISRTVYFLPDHIDNWFGSNASVWKLLKLWMTTVVEILIKWWNESHLFQTQKPFRALTHQNFSLFSDGANVICSARKNFSTFSRTKYLHFIIAMIRGRSPSNLLSKILKSKVLVVCFYNFHQLIFMFFKEKNLWSYVNCKFSKMKIR